MEIKNVLLKQLESLHANGNMHEELNNIIQWSDETEKDQLSKINQFCFDNLTRITVLYAKYLFSKDGPDSIKIKKPQMETLLLGIFTRLSDYPAIKNGTFFTLDPLKQDFVFREAFRMSLSECIDIVNEEKLNEPELPKPEKQIEPELKKEEDMEEEQVLASDSISNFYDDSKTAVEPLKASKTVLSSSSKISSTSKSSKFSKPAFTRKVVLDEQ
jgi:hypothetical protein